MKKPLHIAILDVDVPVPNVYASRGLYSSQFQRLLDDTASRLSNNSKRTKIHTTAFDIVGGQFPPLSSLNRKPRSQDHFFNDNSQEGEGDEAEEDETNPLATPISGILITGSAASAYDTNKKWVSPLEEFIVTVFERYPHVRMFGSCFGHQVIAKALLSRSCLSAGEGCGGEDPAAEGLRVECCPAGKEVGLATMKLSPGFVDAFPCLQGRTEMRLQMVHGDWVAGRADAVPSPWINIGSTGDCPLQGFYYPGRVLTYQGHFEFDSFVNRETCLEFARREGWDEGDVARYVVAIGEVDGDGDDSKLAAEVVVRFFGGEAGIQEVAKSQEGKVGWVRRLVGSIMIW
ncbi:hypothetical protein BO70DRAFT_414780 [Aspergillus heteromorphus CBS 117.55]|uniref:Class I glutamine amidotransferase-like protein n=1 Tax=Aspergillus heteromorphus CBS 117.55 TaxID=1448321 RepID=A0A317V971_9EURO|nr:uncharacterized protein BO70DRAFT_414780 [Aspergillus heteromorphus CBS 117.55]PWY70933.1 hypothetical protein BO70DRAFT_414780 [Aspergillus heteromorphus CBS 117.55]